MINYHLAILREPYIKAVLAGSKHIESRFSRTKRTPFRRVARGDKIFFKVSSGPVCATATVKAVKNFDNLTPLRMAWLKQRYNHDIGGSSEYWQSKMDCSFGLLVWLESVEPIEPLRISKKDWRAWVVLTEKENFSLLQTSVIKKTP